MKSQALQSVVIGLYEALLRDLLYIDPTIQDELNHIGSTLSIIDSRGLAVFTISYPEACKFLERGLRDGMLPSEYPNLFGHKSPSDKRPLRLWALWALIFDEGGMLLPSPNSDAIAGLRQLLLFAKKLRLECGKDKTDAALAEFVEVDEGLPRSRIHTWDHDDPEWRILNGHPLWGDQGLGDLSQEELHLGEALPEKRPFRWGRFRDLCRMVLHSFGELSTYDLRPKHGPGAVADRVVRKHSLPHWPTKLAKVFPADWYASHDLVDRTIDTREYHSRVFCVPKTQKGPRIIACEPTAHQWCQGAIERWLRGGIRQSLIRDSIDLNDQSYSQRAALEASRDGASATVDLSAASDRLSTRLVEYVFNSRFDVLDVLHAARTRSYVMPDGTVRLANKFACMGSACTFPVQTIVFTLVSIFALLEVEDVPITIGSIRNASSRVRVFGDDIILPTSAYSLLVELLTELGLKVNTAKSFGTGKFRESCGLDAYSGVDVTPAYFLQSYNLSDPESLVSIVASSNNFHRKGLWNAAYYLLNTVEPKVLRRLRIARRDVSQPSIFSYAPQEKHLQVRYNPDTQNLEVRALVIDLKIKRDDEDWKANLLQFFSERGSKPLLDEVIEGKGPDRVLGQGLRPKTRLSLRWVLLEDRNIDEEEVWKTA